ncbi:uroporphyrinogen decarboxylase [Spirochaetia bacterium]|nr:uroporphyrinogen decarboxylase [Spirochaetia bacterium]
MTGKERLRSALNHQEPDTVPIFECVYSRPLFQEVLGYVPETFSPPEVFKCYEKIGYDFAFMPIPGVSGFRPEHTREDVYVDEWGITYKKEPSTWPIDAVVKPPLATVEDINNYRVPDAAAEWRWKGYREAAKMAKSNGMGVIGNMRGPYSGTWMLFGMDNFSYLLYDEPEAVDRILTATVDFSIEAFTIMAREGADALLFSDDYGSNTQPLFSLEHFRRFFAPQIRRMVEAAKKLGIPLIMHSDGHIHPFVEDSVNLGVRGLHPIERASGMDLGEVKQQFGDRLCIFGNVDNKHLLVKGTPEEIEAQVKECIHIAGKGGGYCLGSDHSVHDDIPNKNVFALYEAGRKHGRYPLA